MEKRFLISNDNLQIPCILSLPQDGQIRRVVLGVHGIAGSANDRIQAALAEEMSLFYSAVIRFDLPAHGENPCTELTVPGCIDTVVEVARYAIQQYPEAEDLCIFATGFGAYITLAALQELNQLPKKLKLVIQTPCVMMHDTLLSMTKLSQETFRIMEKITFPLARPLDVTYSFYRQLQQNLVLTPHPIAMLILHSQDDDFIRMDDIRHFHQLNERAKLVVIPGTTHRFLEEGAWDMVLDLTRDWFEFEQVMLADWD